MNDEDRIVVLLEQAREIADWNYRLAKRVGAWDEGDRWSATLGHIEHAQQRFPAAASNEAFLAAIHKATPTGQWIAVQHAPDGSGWSVALHPLPWLPGGEVAVKTTPTIPADMVAWNGGESAPPDLDDTKPLWNRAGYPADIARHPWCRWTHAGGGGDIIAYTPLAAAPKQAEQQEVEAIAEAIGKADAAFGYSFNLTRLVDGEETHTLNMPGFDPVEFSDRDEGYAMIAERRNRARAERILAALNAPTGAVEKGEAK